MANRLSIGTRVRVKNTLNYNGRVGVLKANSGDPEDIWDFTCELESAPAPQGTSKILTKLYEPRTIGVMDSQVEAL